MARLAWDAPGAKIFETGLDRGVLYPKTSPGVPWNGLTGVTQSKSGGTSTSYYMDGIRYHVEVPPEDFNATLKAYTYPDEFALIDGTLELEAGFYATQQPKSYFDLSYRTKIGNDLQGLDFGYKLHFIYNAIAEASDVEMATTNNSPTPSVFSWSIACVPVRHPGIRPAAHFIVDSRHVNKYLLAEIEHILYGSETADPRLPGIDELIENFGFTMYRIETTPNGVKRLLTDGVPDLKGNSEEGLYTAALTSRLRPTARPGIDRLD